MLETEGTGPGQAAATLNRPLRWGEPVSTVRTDDAQFVLPTGTVTLLLADIEGSARLWESRAEEMPGAIARHDDLIDETLGSYGGVRPRDQGEGDSFVAAFSRPSDALACALALQLAFADEDWRGTPIRLRIALHTGEVQLRDDDNYIGHTLNRCARIRDLGHGGQTLISQAAFDLTCDRLPQDVSMKDLGTHRLRDLARPERVHQLCHSQLENEFPAPKSLDAVPNNLPVQLTSFIGRSDEMAKVRSLLADTRLLTLTGSGGCGKTRLALQVAADVLEDFPDGVWVIDLSSTTEPSLVSKTVASALRLRQEQGRALNEMVADHIGSQRVLLVLDNCEHLVSTCAEITEALLKSCPSLVIMATSREPLQVPGETPWQVPSLSLPDEKQPARVEALPTFDAVALFIERARKSRPNFRVTNENAPAVAEVCQRLDGIPLAIELAAARVRVLTPKQVADGLHDRFRLLTGSSRIAVPRQQTLRASVDWSYELLSEAEKTVFRRLAVFVGGCTLDIAEHVCSGDSIEPNEVLDVLARLVDRSLVLMQEEGDEGRYHLLQTIREYARDRLADAGEEEQVRTRHRDAYIELVTSTDAQPDNPQGYYWDSRRPLDVAFARFEAEGDNLRAALEWSKQHDDDDALIRMAVPLSLFWIMRWHTDEGRRWLNEVISRTTAQRTEARARALVGLGYLELSQMNAPAVPALAQGGLAISREIGNKALEAASLVLLGTMAAYIGDLVNARPQLERAAALAREILAPEPDDEGAAGNHAFAGLILAAALEVQGSCHIFFSSPADPDAAAGLLDESISAARAAGAEDVARRSLLWRGWGEYMRGDFRRAQPWLEEALLSAREGRSTYMTAWALNFLGTTLIHQGEHERARACYDESLTLGRDRHHTTHWSYAGLASISLREGDLDAAISCYNEALDRTGSPWERRMLLAWLAGAEIEAGRIEMARKHLDEARGLVSADEPYESNRIEAELALREGALDRAEDLSHETIASALRSSASPWMLTYCLNLLGRVAAAQEGYEESARLLAAAEAISRPTGFVPGKLDGERTDAAIARGRDALGPQAFEAAWAEGERMSLDEAIAYAQRGRGERKRPSSGWKSLTPTELEVTKLVAEGLRNAEIAERMFISRHTVESHLKHIYAKLGLSSRTELALHATRRADTS